MTKKVRLKEYGDWLFDNKPSIVNEKHIINEGVGDWLADFGQAAIATIGALPPLEATGISELADATNTVIYFARNQYMNAFFSLISVAPTIGDAIGKSGMVLRYLNNLRRGGGQVADVASWILRNIPRIKPALQTLKTFVTNNKLRIKFIIEYASRKFQELRAARALTEESDSSSEESEEVENLPRPIRMILDFILSNSALGEYFVREDVVRNLQRAVDTAEELFSDLLNLVNDVDENSEAISTSTPSATSTTGTLTEARLKKLAGIID